MPNKHFCQGPYCHTRVTTDRFLKSRGVIRGRYAYFDRDFQNNLYQNRHKYFCSQGCESDWLNHHMENIERGRPIEFITHRRETGGYAKVKNDESRWGPEYVIERVDNRTEID